LFERILLAGRCLPAALRPMVHARCRKTTTTRSRRRPQLISTLTIRGLVRNERFPVLVPSTTNIGTAQVVRRVGTKLTNVNWKPPNLWHANEWKDKLLEANASGQNGSSL
jgi:hypothetical protein